MSIEEMAALLREMVNNPTTRHLSEAHRLFLATLGACQTPVSVGEVGSKLGWRNTGYSSRVLGELEEKGLVTRIHPTKGDRRLTLVALTEEGRDACTKMALLYRAAKKGGESGT